MNSIRIYPPNGYSGQAYRFDFTDENIVSGSMSCERSMMFDTLTPHEFTAEVICDELGSSKLMTSDDKWYHTVNNEGYVIGYQDIRNCVYGSPVEVHFNFHPVEELYLQSIERLSVDHFRIKAFSAVGVWANIQHFGGVYNGETAGTVISSMLQGLGTSYYIAPDVAAVPIYGYLPIASVRDNLQQVLFAIGAFCGTYLQKYPYFYFPSNSSPDWIEKTKIYIGGRLNNLPHATSVRVTEHSYYESSLDVEVSLFDNTDGSGTAENKLVTFSEPCYDLKWNGATVSGSWDSGVNYCYVTGTGVLTGKKYTHTTKIFSVPTASKGRTNEAKIEKATLVSPVNSANVSARVADYKGKADEVAYGIDCSTYLYDVGRYVQFFDPYGEDVTGYIETADYTMSGKTKADCRIITNYIPSNYGNNFENVMLITSNTTWTIPAGKSIIRIVLGQGGQAGQNGYDGNPATKDEWPEYWTYPGDGGSGGVPGNAGKVYVADIANPSGSIVFSIGAGGTPGSGSGALGNTGGETTATHNGTTYSSANGAIATNGYRDILSGITYSEAGTLYGINGASGGEAYRANGKSLTYGNDTWDGGLVGQSYPRNNKGEYAYGGSGGGAAYGAAGGNGGDWQRSGVYSYYDGGDGGSGANALQMSYTPTLGSGGAGGNGGGGGGCPGTSWDEDRAERDYTSTAGRSMGAVGQGGLHSLGTNGGAGYALVFY